MSTIHRAVRAVQALIEAKQFGFYLWVGLVYLMIWLFGESIMYPETIGPRTANNIWRAIYIIVVNYIFFEKLLPQISRKNILKSFFILGVQFLLYSFGLFAWRFVGIQLHIYTSLKSHSALIDGVCYHFPYAIWSFFFFGIIKHVYDYINLKQTAQQLRIEKQEAELNYLKSQTNPHFLFNTLNNVYSLAKDKSDMAPESILRLSEIMRFMLYEAGGAYINIGQEVKIISDYIALEKLRYDDTLRVDFRYEIKDMKQPIPPLLLIPLVENAFKHGVSETINQPFVHIFLAVSHNQLNFIVKNSTENPLEEERVKENIGLSNLRRQLELLYTAYDLSVQQETSEFTASLSINLSSHV